jgi:RecB family exonuclease
MPITLITGPANCGKARVVLDAVSSWAARGMQPLLVVPTRADVERYRRELAERGVVWGVGVERFAGLMREAVRRTGGSHERALSPLARERVLAAVAADADSHSRLAASPGFLRALAAFVVELEVERVTPERLRRALGAWAADGPAGAAVHARRARAAELGALFDGYRRLLREIGRVDPEQQAAQALDAIRRRPALWGGTPVLLYGFDDLTRLQLDTVQTLGRVADAPVTVSLAFEPGRLAFGGRAGTFQTLLPWAAEHRRLEGRPEYYAGHARAALHHLERGLFELDVTRLELDGTHVEAGEARGGPTCGARGEIDGAHLELGGLDGLDGLDRLSGLHRGPAGAVRLLEGGSPRAELELVAGQVKALLDAGVAPEDVAIVHRSPDTVAELLGEVLAACEVPFALQRRRAFSHTAIGRALCGLIRAACGGAGGMPAGSLGDLLAWLRAPGLLEHPELADRLEARARRAGVDDAARARAMWEAEHWPLQALQRLRKAAAQAREGRPAALVERALRELERLFAAPHRRRARVLAGVELDEARGLELARGALTELGELARTAPALAVGPAELIGVVERLELLGGEAPGAGRVAVLDPLALRARRVRALFLCGLQEGVFPAPARAQPLLSEDERRELARASGLRLGGGEGALAAERYLLYASVSRPEELLALSWHSGGADGESAVPSLFLDDVCDLFGERLRAQRVRRPLGAAHWPGPGAAPKAWAAREAVLAAPRHAPGRLAPLRDERLLAELRERRLWSASSLESWAGCPAQWLVERVLRAKGLDPDAEPLARGGLAHEALKDTLAGLRAQSGSARLTAERLELARGLLREALERHAEAFPLSVAPERVPGERRRLRADLERYLEHAANQEGSLEPTYLELSFGLEDLPALDLGGGVRVGGRIDRVDLAPGGEAVVYDYKNSDAPPPDRWIERRKIQMALYMRAVEALLDRRVVGGFYQPLSGRDLRARGALAAGEGVALECVRGDAREREQVDGLLDEAVALAREVAAQADAGLLQARPDTCGFAGGGCRYPTICRCER